MSDIIYLNHCENAYELLLEFNKTIQLYKTEEEMANTINKFLKLGNLFGIIHNNKLIAYYNLYCNNMDTLEAFFGNLYVLSDYRRKGLAESLVLSAIKFAESKHYKRVMLHVAKDNYAANNLYKKLGFEYTGNTKLLGSEDCFEMSYELGE